MNNNDLYKIGWLLTQKLGLKAVAWKVEDDLEIWAGENYYVVTMPEAGTFIVTEESETDGGMMKDRKVWHTTGRARPGIYWSGSRQAASRRRSRPRTDERSMDNENQEKTTMEDGYKNWPIVRKLLIDNRLEHAALLGYSIGVSEAMFAKRALAAYRRVESKVEDSVQIANDALKAIQEVRADIAAAAARHAAKAAENETVVTIDRVTETPEPPKDEPPAGT
jgi:hypothetical protein